MNLSCMEDTKSMPLVKCILNFRQPSIEVWALNTFDAFMWMSSFAAWSVGSVLMFGIIHYEKYGGDPQKRSLGNRLISCSVQCLVMFSLCWQLLMILFRYDLANVHVYIALVRCYMVLTIAAIIFVETSVALRYLQIFVWERVKDINEELAIKAIGRSILLVSAGLGCCLNMNHLWYTNILTFSKQNLSNFEIPLHNCLLSNPNHFDPMNTRVTIPTVLLLSLIFNIIFVARLKMMPHDVRPATVHEPQFPALAPAWLSQRHNKALLTNTALPLVCFFLATGFWITAVQKYSESSKTLGLQFFWASQLITHTVITPLTFYAFSYDARTHVYRWLFTNNSFTH